MASEKKEMGSGNEYRSGSKPSEYQTANTALEARVVECLKKEEKFGTKYKDYDCMSHNHTSEDPGNLTRRKMLATRDITVRLGNLDSAYRVKYNTATQEHKVTKPAPYYPELSAEDITKVLDCIKSSQEGGRSKKTKKRRSKRKHSRRRV